MEVMQGPGKTEGYHCGRRTWKVGLDNFSCLVILRRNGLVWTGRVLEEAKRSRQLWRICRGGRGCYSGGAGAAKEQP